jgi:hypothetical protein
LIMVFIVLPLFNMNSINIYKLNSYSEVLWTYSEL